MITRFLARIFLFVILTTTVTLAIIVLPNYYIKAHAKFQIPPNSTYIILGHSHPRCAFNDSLIDNFSNCAQSAEAYIFTLAKARNIIAQNKNIETVFIEFTNNQIDTVMNSWIWGDKNAYNYSIFFPFLNFSDQAVIARNNFGDFFNNVSAAAKDDIQTVAKHDLDYSDKIGGFFSLNVSKTDSFLALLPLTKKQDTVRYELSTPNIHYLKLLVAFCLEHNKKVFLVRSPLHPKYTGYVNEPDFKKILQSEFSNVDFLDFSKFPLADSEFADLEHLNRAGAKKFSLWFDKIIKAGVLERPYKQKFINDSMDSLTTSNYTQTLY
jgi:hypothetical protein